MARNTLATKLRNKLFGGVTSAGTSPVTSSAPIRNSRGAGFSSTDPLKFKEDDRFSYGTLRYPEDLGSNEFGHYLLFHFYEVSQSKYLGAKTEVLEKQVFNEGTDKERTVNKVENISKKAILFWVIALKNLKLIFQILQNQNLQLDALMVLMHCTWRLKLLIYQKVQR